MKKTFQGASRGGRALLGELSRPSIETNCPFLFVHRSSLVRMETTFLLTLMLIQLRYDVLDPFIFWMGRNVVGEERPDILGLRSMIELIVEAKIREHVLLDARVEILGQYHLLKYVRRYNSLGQIN